MKNTHIVFKVKIWEIKLLKHVSTDKGKRRKNQINFFLISCKVQLEKYLGEAQCFFQLFDAVYFDIPFLFQKLIVKQYLPT